MDELILVNAIERYMNGEMQNDERAHFDGLRATNPEMDQFVVNHIAFLEQLNKAADRKYLLSNIDAVHAALVTSHQIDTESKPEAKVISLWDRYRKKLAVAATVAALFTISAMGLIFAYNNSKKSNEFTEVNRKLKSLEAKVESSVATNSKNGNTRPYVQANTNGTGFVVDEKGYLITNYHVIDGAKEIYAYNEIYGDLKATVVVVDKANDLAVLKINDTSFKAYGKIPYSFKKSGVELSQKVYALGYCRPPYLAYTEGAIASKAANNNIVSQNGFLLSLQVDGGNSGSPIFNQHGEIVGIVSAKEKIENGFTLGIKANAAEGSFITLKEQKLANVKLNTNQLSGLNIEKQTKKVEPFIFMIKAN